LVESSKGEALMFQELPIFQMAGGMARHAGARQAVIAQNIAHADTPGYRARDLPDFAKMVAQPRPQMAATRNGHLGWQPELDGRPTERRTGDVKPNGNTVVLEGEMQASVQASQHHRRALTIYKSALGILRSAIGRR
jgi:flagellar basal-body rod protein FlgB